MYTECDIFVYQADWGDGYMSPGGDDEVSRMFEYAGVDPEGKVVVDLGSGLGGPAVWVAKKGAEKVTAIDVDEQLHEKARDLAKAQGVSKKVEFIAHDLNELSLTLGNESVDIVFSKDSIVDVEKKEDLFREMFRILKPGGWLVASDWLKGERPDPLDDWQDFIGNWQHGADLLLTAKEVTEKLRNVGFCPVCVESRREAVTEIARRDLESISPGGKLRGELEKWMEENNTDETPDDRVARKERLYKALACGGLDPSHIRGRKPYRN